MKVLLTTCLLFALLPAVASLQCYACAGNQKACNKPTKIECEEDEDTCLSLISAVSVDDLQLSTTAAKTCVQSQYWRPGNYSLATVQQISFNTIVKTCQKNLCNMQPLTPPRRSQLPENGRTCPACLSFSNNTCQSTDSVTCQGNETKCMYLGVIVNGPGDAELPVAFRGCVTANACNLKEGETEAAGGIITGNITRVKCMNAPMSGSALEGYVKASQLLFNLPFMGMKLRDERLWN